MTTYTITNDRYSNTPDEVTFDQLIELCQDAEFDTNLIERGGKVYDSKGEVVAEKVAMFDDSETQAICESATSETVVRFAPKNSFTAKVQDMMYNGEIWGVYQDESGVVAQDTEGNTYPAFAN
ncbi:hypothetical protein [Fibrella forsythiae]|uniref:Uncharacterized protein n=1 Tax=Fibrella forsythiae TaxID=2817061 RepID=A0ABS3JB60_9BACT|nr:hypothetical protein [Fibrella forsythiae]MBO0947228.1 hypothetical protein [Fibrella forsythiae]